MNPLQTHADNLAVWLILVTAVTAYAMLADLILGRERSTRFNQRCRVWVPAIRTLLGALPLLGLYGTVVGLMETFQQMAVDYGFNPETLATGGIASAMYTTQLGLLLVIPGWLTLAWLSGWQRRPGDATATRKKSPTTIP
ncbi:MAG: MotA/TolQ/ExbB proton channel family protein [Pseudomonadota bacterium]